MNNFKNYKLTVIVGSSVKGLKHDFKSKGDKWLTSPSTNRQISTHYIFYNKALLFLYYCRLY